MHKISAKQNNKMKTNFFTRQDLAIAGNLILDLWHYLPVHVALSHVNPSFWVHNFILLNGTPVLQPP